MTRTILFEGKVTIAGQLVDFRIYKNQGSEIIPHYSFEINPEIKDVDQIDYYRGGIQMAEDLESLFAHFEEFRGLIKQIDTTRINTLF